MRGLHRYHRSIGKSVVQGNMESVCISENSRIPVNFYLNFS